MHSKKVYLHTFGCKINQYETQALKEKLHAMGGMKETSSPGQADCILLNSCAVTSRALQDLRKAARRFYRENPGVSIVVTGCAVKHFGKELGDLPGVEKLVPQEAKSQAAKYIHYLCNPGESVEKGQEAATQEFFPFEDLNISDFSRARPVVKVQDGCSRVCTYCIVPLSRGGSRSRDPGDIAGEIDRLYANGMREVVISGINLAQYEYRSWEMGDFWDLVVWLDRELYRKYGQDIRLRLSSLDPSLLDSKGLETLTGSKLVCPHLHISLQSASSGVLSRMGRSHYQGRDIKEFINRLNSHWRIYALGVDILLGFPGESSEDFRETYDFVLDMPFTYGHVFVFSPRPGTRASRMSPAVSRSDKKQRSREMHELFRAKKDAFLQRLEMESSLRVIVEQENPGLGMNEYYTLSYFNRGQEGLQKASLVETRPVSASAEGIYVERLT
ncbi:MAG: MiaB/RimO family radical SAM methylthiotransferase [Thermodesulfobacteriota bacterium]